MLDLTETCCLVHILPIRSHDFVALRIPAESDPRLVALWIWIEITAAALVAFILLLRLAVLDRDLDLLDNQA